MSATGKLSRTLGGALAASLLVLSFGALGACKKKESTTTTTTTPAPPPYTPPPAPVETGVKFMEAGLGKAIGADKAITQASQTFAPKDTVYVSVSTSGSAASASLRALWTYQDGQVVSDNSQTIAPMGSDKTEFHISKPDGFPAGSYNVEIFLNGNSVSKIGFTVS